MKKALSVLLLFVLLFTFSSCDAWGQNPGGETPPNDGETTLGAQKIDIRQCRVKSESASQKIDAYICEQEAGGQTFANSVNIDDKYCFYYFYLGTIDMVPVYSSVVTQYNGYDFELGFEFTAMTEDKLENTVSKSKEVIDTSSYTSGYEIDYTVSVSAKLKTEFSEIEGSFSSTERDTYNWTHNWGNVQNDSRASTTSYIETFGEGHSLLVSFSEENGFEVGNYYRFGYYQAVKAYGVLIYDMEQALYTSTTQTVLENSEIYFVLEESKDRHFDYQTADHLLFDIEAAIQYAESHPRPDSGIEQQPEDVGDIVNFAGGRGTEEKPYLIASVSHLVNVEKDLTAHYRLLNDIDLSGIEWEPLGGYQLEEGAFTGVFDGNGYHIIGLTRTKDVPEKNDLSYFGLFGGIGDGGVVQNIEFTDVNVRIAGPFKDNGSMDAFYGVVAGKCEGTIDHITVSGSFVYTACTNGTTWLGGICGHAANAEIRYCTNHIDLSADRYACIVGGIVAYAEGGIIHNCNNTGYITAVGTDWGGNAHAGCIGGETSQSNPTRLLDNHNSGGVTTRAYDNSFWFGGCDCREGNLDFAYVIDRSFE